MNKWQEKKGRCEEKKVLEMKRIKRNQNQELSGDPLVRAPRFPCKVHGFDPWLGN